MNLSLFHDHHQYSLACPNCSSPFVDIPADMLKMENDDLPALPPSAKRWSKRPVWISRPLNRQESEPAMTHVAGSDTLGLQLNGTNKDRRRASTSESIISDSSSQTKVDPAPILRSILSHAPSVSSGKDSTLTAKRSVKFSEEPIYYDYSYRYSHAYRDIRHAPDCKQPDDCYGDCLYEGYCCTYDYDVDMFSFEQPEHIPSEKRWGIFSRFIAWLRRKSGRCVYTIEEGKRRPQISRPQPLAPRAANHAAQRQEEYKRRGPKRSRTPLRTVWEGFPNCR